MHEKRQAPTFPLNDQTLVFDVDRQRQVAYLDGRLPLPLSATIELYDEATNSHGTATVIGVRLLNGTAEVPNQLCLDVTVEDRWWARFDEREANEDQA